MPKSNASDNFPAFQLFMSHLAQKKSVASALSDELAYFGIDGFVAHEHIQPTAAWQAEIEAALATCDGLLALVHQGFKDSDWTDQEIGWVLGRSKAVISVRYDAQPYGFFGQSQAFNGNNKSVIELAQEIFEGLAAHPKARKAISRALVGVFCKSGSFDEANTLAANLPLLHYWDDDLREQVEAATVNNSQVSGAYDVSPILKELKKSW